MATDPFLVVSLTRQGPRANQAQALLLRGIILYFVVLYYIMIGTAMTVDISEPHIDTTMSYTDIP